MAGEITTIFGAILAIADAVRMLARAYAVRRGRPQPGVLPVIFILGLAIIILGMMAIGGVEPLTVLP